MEIVFRIKCRVCTITKDSNEFHKHHKMANGFDSICKECNKTKSTRWLKNNHKVSSAIQAKKNYGISRENFKTLMAAKCCEICKKEFTINNNKDKHIDHCHTSKKIRGILCFNCNTALGKFRDDSKLLLEAIKYLKNNGNF